MSNATLFYNPVAKTCHRLFSVSYYLFYNLIVGHHLGCLAVDITTYHIITVDCSVVLYDICDGACGGIRTPNAEASLLQSGGTTNCPVARIVLLLYCCQISLQRLYNRCICRIFLNQGNYVTQYLNSRNWPELC